MRYLADENLPLQTVKALREDGLEIKAVKEIMPGASDQDILKAAVKEERTIITFDKDFGDWVFRCGIKGLKTLILLRYPPRSPEYITANLRRLLKMKIAFDGAFIVASDEKIRVVPLP